MTDATTQEKRQLREAVRQRYAAAASRVAREDAWTESATSVSRSLACAGPIISPAECCTTSLCQTACADLGDSGRLISAFVRATKPD
jgi:hypothetical protein